MASKIIICPSCEVDITEEGCTLCGWGTDKK